MLATASYWTTIKDDYGMLPGAVNALKFANSYYLRWKRPLYY